MGKGFTGDFFHSGDDRDRVIVREATTQPGGDQHITDHDIGILRDVFKIELVVVPGTESHRAEAGAVYLNGYGVTGIGE